MSVCVEWAQFCVKQGGTAGFTPVPADKAETGFFVFSEEIMYILAKRWQAQSRTRSSNKEKSIIIYTFERN